MSDNRVVSDEPTGTLASYEEERIVWNDMNVPPGVIRHRDGKAYLDERELTEDVVRELGGKIQRRRVTPWEDV